MLDLHKDPLLTLSDALLGQVLPGSEGRRYPLRERIGQGGQGWVFRATWNGSIDVVVKVLRPDVVTSEAIGRFQREAHVLRALTQQATPNPHIVRFFDHAYANVYVPATQSSWNLPFTVLELVEGETLQDALDRAKPAGLGLDRARRILSHVVLALEDVHSQNVVHRDLKPSNILLGSSGTREIAKVTDFGLAKLLDPGMQRTSHLAGATVGYAPPEQFEDGNLRVGRHTDVFSLAAVFYELVTGLAAFPFHPNAHPLMVVVRILSEARPAFARVRDALPPELAERPDVVDAVDAELARALSPDPMERHATVVELRDGLERALVSLGSVPSVPVRPSGGRVVVRSMNAPSGAQDEYALVPNPLLSTAPVVSTGQPSSRSISRAARLVWRRITPSLSLGVFDAIAVTSTGASAVAVGHHGVGVWHRGVWTRIDLLPGLDVAAMHACGWQGDRVVLAGTGSLVASIGGSGAPTFYRVETSDCDFRTVFIDGAGIVLAGARSTPRGPIGIIAEIDPRSATGAISRLLEIPGTTQLRAVARLGHAIVACGDAGALVVALPGESARVSRVCDQPLHAVIAVTHEMAVAAGRGGFLFKVWTTLEARLEPIDTTRELFALANGPDDSLWCASAAGRVLRRDSEHWIRVDAGDVGGDVRALHAGVHRVLAFCDDGGVFEGMAK